MSDSLDVFERAARGQRQPREGSASPVIHRRMLWGIGIASSIAGAVMVCLAANPEMLSTLSTAHLLGSVVLMLCPLLTAAALRLERRASTQVVVSTQRTPEEPVLRIAKHSAHDRVRRPHTRADETHQDDPRPHAPAA
ncbi:MAG: hypothetical protein ACX94C_14060 [Phycisphaerales bacterium]